MTRVMSARLWKAAVAATVLTSSLVAAQTSSATFEYPLKEELNVPGGPIRLTINVFDTVNLEWDSNYDQAFLYLWCEDGDPNSKDVIRLWSKKEVKVTGVTPYSPFNDANTSQSWGVNPFMCHFDFRYKDNGEHLGISGPAMNITSRRDVPITTYARQFTSVDSAATSAGAPNVTPNSALLTVISPTGESSPTSTSTSTSTSNSESSQSNPSNSGSDGLSAGATAGIVIGVVGGLAVIAALAYLFFRNNRKLRELESRMPLQEDNSYEYKPEASVVYAHEQPVGVEAPQTFQPPVELDPNRGTYELAGHELDAAKRT